MPRPLVVVTEPEYLGAAVPVLRRAARVRVGRFPRRTLLRLVRDAEALLVRIETRVDAALLRRAPRLRVVGSATTGLDHVDVAACRRRGVRLVHLHGTHTEPTAEHALALLLALARRIPAASLSMARGAWDRHRFLGNGVAGKTLGVVGIGRIGSAVARRALALGMDVVAYDPFVPRPSVRGVRMVRDLRALLKRSDFVTVHASLNPTSRGLLGRRALAAAQPGALVANTARGPIVPSAALLAALRSGRLGGAAVDVYDDEPLPAGHALRRYARAHPERLILTPHLGASTREAADASAREVARGVLRTLLRRGR